MFNPFQINPNLHLRRVSQLLREANMGRVEHAAAAEHHGALARMYAERADRLERESYDGIAESQSPARRVEPPVLVENNPVVLVGQKPRLSSL